MKRIDKLNKSDFIYLSGILIILLFVAFAALYNAMDLEKYITGHLPECYFRKTSGIICPGCGMTRAVKNMLNFKFLKSSLYHIIPVFGCVCFGFLMIKETLHRTIGINGVTEKLVLKLVYVGIALDLVQWIIKLICIYVFGIIML